MEQHDLPVRVCHEEQHFGAGSDRRRQQQTGRCGRLIQSLHSSLALIPRVGLWSSNYAQKTDIPTVNIQNTGVAPSLSVVEDGIGPDIGLKGIKAGTGIRVVDDTTNHALSISTATTFTGEDILPADVATSANLVADTTTNETFKTKYLRAGASSGITLTNGLKVVDLATDVTLASEVSTVPDDPNAFSLVASTNAPNRHRLRFLRAGTGVSFVTTDQRFTINGTGGNVQLASAAADPVPSLVVNSQGPNISIRGVSAGAGVSVATSADTMTISNTSPASSVTLVDASTAGSGALSLVATGGTTGPNLKVCGLRGSMGIDVVADVSNGCVAVANKLRFVRQHVCVIQPRDVTTTTGQMYVSTSLTCNPASDNVNWPAAVKPFGLQTVRYAASTTTPHSGTLVAILYGLPPDGLLGTSGMGFDLDVTLLAAGAVSASTWSMSIGRGANAGGTWSGATYTFTLTVPALTDSSQPATIRAACTTADSTLRTACLDGTTKPSFSLYKDSLYASAAEPMVVSLACTTALASDLHIAALRFTFLPSTG